MTDLGDQELHELCKFYDDISDSSMYVKSERPSTPDFYATNSFVLPNRRVSGIWEINPEENPSDKGPTKQEMNDSR